MTASIRKEFSWLRLMGTVLAAAFIAGCAGNDDSTKLESRTLGTSDALLTTADIRLISATPRGAGSLSGRVNPKQIICVEPSPDIAKAVSANFNFGGSLGLGGLPSGVTADVALSFARARAESVAQMTERLATIQLLRDGLYRACEAYANGAISDTTYAVILSRYDDTMVTLLLGELAAGNFGRKLATLGGGTGGGSSALIKRARGDRAASDQAQADLSEADAEVGEKNRAVGAADARVEAAAPGTPEKSTAEADLGKAEAELQAAEAKRDALKDTSNALLHTAASSSATAFADSAGGVAGSGVSATDRATLAGHLANMQRKYIENINSDALVVACISALDRPLWENPSSLGPQHKALKVAYQELLGTEAKALSAPMNVDFKNAIAAAEDSVKAKAAALAAAAGGTPGLTPFAAYCLSGIMPQILVGSQRMLAIILQRKDEAKIKEALFSSIDTVKEIDSKLKELKILTAQ
jgi:hypothetical protein